MKMYSKYAGKCSQCGARFEAGDRIEWDKTTKQVQCGDCMDLNDVDAKPPTKGSIPADRPLPPMGDEDLYPTRPDDDESFDPDAIEDTGDAYADPF